MSKHADLKSGQKDMDSVTGSTYYVATSGNDNNPGTINLPWATWQKAFITARPGDTVYFRGGVWMPTSTPTLTRHDLSDVGTNSASGNGNPENQIRFFNYRGELPILNCQEIKASENNCYGMKLDGVSHIYLKGLTIANVGKNPIRGIAYCGIHVSNCYGMTFENITIHDIAGDAFHYGSPDDESILNTTIFLHCDAYDNHDPFPLPGNIGNAASGFIVNGGLSTTFKFAGCRAWNNPKNGFEFYGNNLIEVSHCWAFNNGMPDGDGYGFLIHGMSRDLPDRTRRRIVNSIASRNFLCGFCLEEHPDRPPTYAEFINNAAFANKCGFRIIQNRAYDSAIGKWRNNLAYRNTVEPIASGGIHYIGENNSWQLPFDITDDDFVSLNDEELKRPRKEDGSLPDIDFLKPKNNSFLVDGGRELPIQ